jgi:hypothetical protein
MMNLWRAGLVVILIAAATCSATFGQSTFGTILGTVHDTSGAVMPGCAVTIENTGTSAKRSAVTDETGLIEPKTWSLAFTRSESNCLDFRLRNSQAFS